MTLSEAVKLYASGELSAGKAAELAGIPKLLFLSKLGEFGVSVFEMDRDELRKDARTASRED